MSITKQDHNAKWMATNQYKSNYDRIFKKKKNILIIILNKFMACKKKKGKK